MFRRTTAVCAAVMSLAVVLSSCSSSKKSASTSAPATSTTSAAPTTSSAATSEASSPAASSPAAAKTLFGPGCATLGLTDQELAPAVAAPVATVVGNVPFLSNVIAASNAAGLTNTLNAAPALTVFAPVDDAFKKEPPGQLQSLLTNPKMKSQLVATLKYHIVGGKIQKAQLAGKHTTLEGQAITVAGSGDAFTVNGTAKIICGGIQTKNAVVYLLDTVLHPAA